ncbi:capsid maturation protease [Cercopithecine betaherpesvirus 5]|uniref:Capsid scaffolding protein n=2 Tax=Simian cytomegalovirus (strain Colburn) TaxID=50292 RepID=G8XTE2_SCMVC|nr:capsid maturation protease [Cercopithecine betaherpesvirus 5]AEV80434.1 capsid maturation protease [Cercopithecine betaherpesvirus 5]
MADPVYVGGFLVRYDEPPGEAELFLPSGVVDRWLRDCRGPLPLNVNHDESATVGYVAGLQNVRAGLFCLGRVTSPKFLDIVQKASEKSELVSRGPPSESSLRPDGVLEFLSGSYSGLSLSSRRDINAADGAAGDAETACFKHVALCSVGRRRGTLAVYGRQPDWVMERFPDLTEADREALRNQLSGSGEVAAKEKAESSAAAVDPFQSDSYGLLGNSVDALYIQERLPKLRYDKRLVGVTARESYVKASVSPAEQETCDIKVEKERPKEPEQSHVPAESMSHPMSAVATPAASTVAPSQAPLALAHDGVYLPKDAFFSLIGASRPLAEAAGARAAYPAVPPPPAYPVMNYEDPSSRHFDYSAWLRRPAYDAVPPLPPPPVMPMPYRRRDPMMEEAERAAWERGYAPSAYDHYVNNGSWSRSRSGALKRRRERDASSDEEEDMSFPGEADHGKARKRLKAHHGRDNNNSGSDAKGDRYDDIREALQELKREMLAVRQIAPAALLAPAQLATPVASPTTTTSHQAEASEPQASTAAAAPSTASSHGSKSAERGVVNASCRVAPPLEVVNPPKDMVDLNRRLFVAALNKME